MTPIDLRSDTVTTPTAGMLNAMMKAKIGDDVFGEDPSVNELQEKTAQIFGHEAGLFCPSGTMTNQIAIQVHTRPGDEVICHENAHIYNYEGAGIARNALASVRLVVSDLPTMTAPEVENLIREPADYSPRTALISVEDTSNRGGGACYSFSDLKEISELAKSQNLVFHLDGARVFNAIIAKGQDPIAYGKLFHSISICLSKGLGAPVGSVLIGDKNFIKEARRVRKVMGGGMRQAGFLAAAGIYALENHIERLAQDHENAKHLAGYLTGLKEVTHIIEPETNIVIFDVNPQKGSAYFIHRLEQSGLRAVSFGKNRIRMVCHLGITKKDIPTAGAILQKVLD